MAILPFSHFATPDHNDPAYTGYVLFLLTEPRISYFAEHQTGSYNHVGNYRKFDEMAILADYFEGVGWLDVEFALRWIAHHKPWAWLATLPLGTNGGAPGHGVAGEVVYMLQSNSLLNEFVNRTTPPRSYLPSWMFAEPSPDLNAMANFFFAASKEGKPWYLPDRVGLTELCFYLVDGVDYTTKYRRNFKTPEDGWRWLFIRLIQLYQSLAKVNMPPTLK